MVKELIEKYQETRNDAAAKVASLRASIFDLENQISFMEARISDLRQKRTSMENTLGKIPSPSWVDLIVQPLSEQLQNLSGFQKWRVLGPAGIGCRTTICLWSTEPNASGKELTLQPMPSEQGFSLLYETGELNDWYKPGSLGAKSGLNIVTASLPDSPEEVLALMTEMSAESIRILERAGM